MDATGACDEGSPLVRVDVMPVARPEDAAFEAFRREWLVEFEALDKLGETLTEEETPLGSFISLSLP